MPKPFAILIATLMALYFVPFIATPASAAVVGGFEIEGDLDDDPVAGIDWENFQPGDAGFNTGVDNTTATGQDSTVFSGSSKEYVDAGDPGGWPAWTYGTGNATGKSDFGRWATYDFVDDDDHVWFFLGFDRKAGEGTAKYVFELNQLTQSPKTDPNPDRSQGDIRLVVWDQGNGLVTLEGDDKNDDVGLYRWVDADDQDADELLPDTDNDGAWVKIDNDGVFAGASNTGETPIDVPSWWTSGNVSNGQLDKDEFLEFGIDLTSFGAIVGCPSAGFTAVNARSITGTGGPGTLVDYLEAIPVTIPSNCASLQILKVDGEGEPLGGATFKIEPNPLPEGTPGRPDADFVTIFDDSDNNTTKEGSTNYDDPDAAAGQITLPAVVPDVEYTITEIIPPDGYIGEDDAQTVMPEPFSDENVVTFVNTLGSLKFFKNYEGAADLPADGGAVFRIYRETDGNPGFTSADENFTVKDDIKGAESSGGTVDDEDNSTGVIKVSDLKTGDYMIKEIQAPTGWVLDTDEVEFSIPGAEGEADVVLDDPTFTDPRATYPLTVRKVSEADNTVLIDGAVFDLYKETNGTSGLQTGGDTKVGSCTTGALAGDADKGECTVANLAWGAQYYWYEVSVPSPYNLPDDRVIGPITINADGTHSPSGVAVFEDPQSVIETEATNGALPEGAISDTATLSGIRQDAGGSITFSLWDNNTCTGEPIFVSNPVAVDGPGTYGPVQTTVTEAGDYFWIAAYSGDPSTGTLGVSGLCGDEGETSTVIPATPGIHTVVVDDEVTLSDAETTISDKATLSGGSNPTGTITFTVYGPFEDDPTGDDTVCTEANEFDSVPATTAVNGNGVYTSQTVTVTDVGYYIWVADYSGDDNNDPISEDCGSADEVTLVNPAEPEITTEAQQSEVTLSDEPTTLSDEATLTGATDDATGSISFSLYGPFDTDPGADSCVEGKLVGTVGSVEDFTGNGTYTSEDVTVTEAGYYTWVATYTSGDDNNLDATHACGQAEETTLVNPAEPEIDTQVPDSTVELGVDGTELTDTATLSGATSNATGTITFTLYGPFGIDEDLSCTEGNVYDADNNPSSVNVDGNGDYDSDAVTVTEAGIYTWMAHYSGDDNNLEASHACGLESETVTVTPRQPVIATQVSSTEVALSNGSVSFSDSATISGGTSDIAGSITFRLFGPFPQAPTANSCAEGGTVVGSPVPVDGNGTYQGPTASVSVKGWYTWMATFNSSDGDNMGAVHACGLASETVKVTEASPTLEKVANPVTGSVVQPGQTITYTVSVGNVGDAAIEDGVVTDILPPYVVPNLASVAASGGTFVAGPNIAVSAGTITWLVDLAPGQTTNLVYSVVVSQTVPTPASLINKARFFQFEKTTTHLVPQGALNIVKEVSPVAGGGTVVEFGDTLTYTLTVSATGQLVQPNVKVEDYVPGYDPARPKSGKTTYVKGSAKCVGAVTTPCTVTEPGANHLITWQLGNMDGGTSRQVQFKVTIDDVEGDPGETVAVDILNAGAVQSNRTPKKPSNQVITPVTKVFPVKAVKPPKVLPHTGSSLPPGPVAALAIALLGMGIVLMAGSRRRGTHRA